MRDWTRQAAVIIVGAAVGGAAGGLVCLSVIDGGSPFKTIRCESLEVVSPSGAVVGRLGMMKLPYEVTPHPPEGMPKSVVRLTLNSEDGTARWELWLHEGGATGFSVENAAQGAKVNVGIGHYGEILGQAVGAGGKGVIECSAQDGGGFIEIRNASGDLLGSVPPIGK